MRTEISLICLLFLRFLSSNGRKRKDDYDAPNERGKEANKENETMRNAAKLSPFPVSGRTNCNTLQNQNKCMIRGTQHKHRVLLDLGLKARYNRVGNVP